MAADERFEMRVDLAVLQSLGINLYSNAAAVLSEVVANAWDADANEIAIDWDVAGDRIRIQDDGIGMDLDDVNDKFLKVGYQKRAEGNDGSVSPKFNRPYMGRKGIGKLSVFSLADEITIATRKQGFDAEAFKITRAKLEKKIEEGDSYNPDSAAVPDDLPSHGTRIVLESLNLKRASVTLKALRRRIARRFDVLQYDPAAADRFRIVINGDAVGFSDREDLARIEYFWSLGPTDIPASRAPGVRNRWELDGTVDESQGWHLGGWFGTVKAPSDLEDDDDQQESLRNMIIMARKRPIQEGILDQLHFNKIFGNYVTGQITAEFLDDSNQPDIATSDRQRLMEDDERVVLLRQKLRERFLEAERQWTEARREDKFKDLTKTYPEIRDWAEHRDLRQRAAAKKLVGTIAALTLDEENDRRELFRAGILGFERIALDATAVELDKFAAAVTAADVMPLLASQRALEDALYVQILRSRIAAIGQLEKLIAADELERALQEHLFQNLWLLDASWEHATADPIMEQTLKRLRGDLFAPSEQENLDKGRIDIKYRTAAGTHVIIELKRYKRATKLDELYDQGSRYWQAMKEILTKEGQPDARVEVVFVLGRPTDAGITGAATADEVVSDRLKYINGRVLYYDQMLNGAKRQYESYAKSIDTTQGLAQVLASLDPSPRSVRQDSSAASESTEGEEPGDALAATPAEDALLAT